MVEFLRHHGIKGQQWGVRRYQNKDGTLTNADKKRYRATREDRALYGEKGAKRIAERQNKGDSRLKAEAKEVALQTAKSAAPKLAFTTMFYLTSSGKMFDIIDFAKERLSPKYDMKIIDSNGREVTEALLKM